MARIAIVENVGQPPAGAVSDYRMALAIIDTINARRQDIREAQGELTNLYRRVVHECGVNKAAAKVFNDKVLRASEEKRADFLRSFFGLMRAHGIAEPHDMIDSAVSGVRAPLPGVCP